MDYIRYTGLAGIASLIFGCSSARMKQEFKAPVIDSTASIKYNASNLHTTNLDSNSVMYEIASKVVDGRWVMFSSTRSKKQKYAGGTPFYHTTDVLTSQKITPSMEEPIVLCIDNWCNFKKPASDALHVLSSKKELLDKVFIYKKGQPYPDTLPQSKYNGATKRYRTLEKQVRHWKYNKTLVKK